MRAVAGSSTVDTNQVRVATTVDVVDDLGGLDQLREAWNSVHDRDPHAGYFLSWRWLHEVARANPGCWSVVVARSGSSTGVPVCFLPLRIKHRWSRRAETYQTTYEAFGRLSWGQYSGFVCAPEFEHVALPAIARHLSTQRWTKLTLKYLSEPDHRVRHFLDGFGDGEVEVGWSESMINGGTVNNLLCPYVTLPDDFDTYLATKVSSNTRQKIRRFARTIRDDHELRFTVADANTFHRDLDRLLEMWERKWAPRRGTATADEVSAMYREILGQSFALDAVRLSTLWRGERPLGAVAGIVDRPGRRMYFIVSGRDETAVEQFIGMSLHAHHIEWAISEGLDVYDFCHGNESYKYSFGAVDREVRHLVLRR